MIESLGRLWRMVRPSVLAALVLVSVWPATPWAHEVPRRVAIQAFVHPEARVVRVLVRVPVEAMRDVEFPLRGAFLDLTRADSMLRDAARLWVADAMAVTADGRALGAARLAAVRASLPSDHAFERYSDAVASTTGAPLPVQTDIAVGQVMLDVLLEYPLGDARPTARLAIVPQLAHLGVKTTTVLRFVPIAGAERAYVYEGDPGEVQLEPAWWHAAARFVQMGASHLFDGIDHLLFLFCLILPVRRLRPLVGIVTAFTLAHSMTLAVCALGYAPDALWFPPLVEFLIAGSIVFMAIENVVGAKLERRWMMAFAFGLVHGFGFSFALRDSLQFAGGHLLTALAAFNIGIEVAQLLVLAIGVPLLAVVFSRIVAERTGVLVGSVLIAHTSWHWMIERFDALRAYAWRWPDSGVGLAVGVIRFSMGVLIVGGVAWAISGVMARLTAPRSGAAARVLMLLAATSLGAVLVGTPRLALAQNGGRTTMAGVYSADQAVKGKDVFKGTCSGCHTVASHSGPVFAARWVGRPLSEFFDYLTRLMPKSAPGTLSEDEYVWVTAYVLKLNGMPPGPKELVPEPAILKAIRIDTLPTTGRGTHDGTHDGSHDGSHGSAAH